MSKQTKFDNTDSKQNSASGPHKSKRTNMRGKQGRKDSRSKRVNFDNERVSTFEKDMKKCDANDVRWYANNPEMLKAAASLPFSTTVGENLPWASSGKFQSSVPGVMSLAWTPAVGGKNVDALNQAAKSVYSFVVHANSRNTSYTANDLMVLIMAGANLFSTLAHVIRMWGTVRMYDQRNKYLPDALLWAMGFQADNVRANLPDIWFTLNDWVARSKNIWIPNSFPLIERWFWLNSNVYEDAGSVKSQKYLFVPSSVMAFNEVGYETGSAVTMVGLNTTTNAPELIAPGITISSDGKTYSGIAYDSYPAEPFSPAAKAYDWNTWKNVINFMFECLMSSEDRGIMFGDILKAYGSEKLYSLTPITADYTIIPTYNTEVLSQIENATIMTAAGINSIFQMQGGNSRLAIDYSANLSIARQYVGWGAASAFTRANTILNFHTDGVPTPEMIMVATRLKAYGPTNVKTFKQGSTTNYVFVSNPENCGSEIINGCFVFVFNNTGVSQKISVTHCDTTQASQAGIFTNVALMHTAFDWAPVIDVLSNGPTSMLLSTTQQTNVDSNWLGVLLDFDNYTTIDATSLAKMHNTALYGEFGVPIL